MRTEGWSCRLRPLWTAMLLGLTPAVAGVAAAAEARAQEAPPRLSKRPDPFRLSIERSQYVLQGNHAGLSGSAGTSRQRRVATPGPFAPLIERQARAKGVDPELVHAVIRAESAYRADAISPKGAVGLMQLMPATARRFGVVDREHPESNVSAGTAYLRLLLDRFNSVPLALAAYNAGEGAVMRHGNQIPPYAETRGYVARILRDYGDTPIAPVPLPHPYATGLRLADAELAPYRLIRTRSR
ncbi:MAG: lytic transglycosylase domain-containing protein [Accumulibacter sp.]|uniref:lytic transglycosylase domain-containing protein n=1 Tax=Accumulibacter sp. TaxID=2053492 RepID=UPI002FC398CE